MSAPNLYKHRNKEQYDILVLADDIRGYGGFSVNCRLVCWALADKWDVANAAPRANAPAKVSYKGRTVDVLPARNSPRTQGLGHPGIKPLIETCQPEVVITLVDTPMVEYLADLRLPLSEEAQIREMGSDLNQRDTLHEMRQRFGEFPDEPRFTWVAQVPIDGHPLPSDRDKFFEEVDYPVAMAEYGAEVVKDQFGIEIPVIKHAVDFQNAQAEPSDDFFVGTVNDNQFRKQYPRLIEAWGKFYEMAGRPDDVSFYMHCDWENEDGWPLQRYVSRWGLDDVMEEYQGYVSRKTLMYFYSSFDVFCSATGGEGFGLTTAEAMAHGCPVIITDYTTSEELVMEGDPSPRGSLIEPALMYDEHPRFAATKRALVDTDEFAETLLKYYNNPERVEREGRNGKKWVSENLSWKQIASDWESFIAEEVW